MRPVGIIRSQSQECTQKDRVRDSDGELLGDDGSADEAQSRNDVDEVSNATGQDDRCSGRKEAKDGWLSVVLGNSLIRNRLSKHRSILCWRSSDETTH